MKRLHWFLSILTLAFLALISDELIEYVLREYEPEDIKQWWRK